MQLIMLLQPAFGSVPDTLNVVENYGPESIVDPSGTPVANGNVVYLEGEVVDFVKWLGAQPGIWCCSSPLMGDWQLMHVELEYTLEVSYNRGLSYMNDVKVRDLSDTKLVNRIIEVQKKGHSYRVTDQFGGHHGHMPELASAVDVLKRIEQENKAADLQSKVDRLRSKFCPGE